MKTLHELLELEPTEPAQTILKVLAKHDGKMLTVRQEKELKEACQDPTIRIYRDHTTRIKWGGCVGSHGPKHPNYMPEGSLLIAYAEKNVTIDVKKIAADYNPAYYKGTEERNAKRQQLQKDAKKQAEILRQAEHINQLQKDLQQAKEELKDFIEDLPFHMSDLIEETE